MMENFDEWQFEQKLEKTLAEVKRILHTERHPVIAGDVHHAYSDKYCLAESLTNTALAASLNCLESIGLDNEKLSILIDWAKKGNAVWLEASDGVQTCQFLRMEEREEKSKHKVEKDSSMFGKTTQQVVTNIKEYFYKIGIEYQIVARCNGQDPQYGIISTRKGVMDIKTTSEVAPLPAKAPITLSKECPDITFLLKELSNGGLAFRINRKENCHTPMRNSDIELATKFFIDLRSFVRNITTSLHHLEMKWKSILKETDKNQPKVNLIQVATCDKIFIPILPVFEQDQKGGETQETASKIAKLSQEDSAVTFNLNDTNRLLHHQKETLHAKLKSIDEYFQEGNNDQSGLMTTWEGRVMATLLHCEEVCQQYLQSLYYIEHMICKQIHAAIGKSLSKEDFDKYMRFHDKKIFSSEFLPVPFSYAVRRPGHFPEGTISIEDDDSCSPIFTLTRKVNEGEVVPMTFKINAATDITFTGDRYLHAFVATSFSSNNLTYTLSAHARQFSCFLLLLGRIGPEHTFEPKYSILLQNKDDLKIPVLLETLPTPKEFKDAIESLSPEQQRFAKAYRSMQLEGTVFGLLTIQLKPQLEKLLKLPADSLTKEIALTQDLLKLFIDYQIPSDLLSFDGDHESEVKAKLETVKGHVNAIMDMLDKTKKEQLDETADRFVQDKLETDNVSGFLSCVPQAAASSPYKSNNASGFSGFQSASAQSFGAQHYQFQQLPAVRREGIPLSAVLCAAPPPPPASMLESKRRSRVAKAPNPVSLDGIQKESGSRSHSQRQTENSSDTPYHNKIGIDKEKESKMDVESNGTTSALDFTKVPSILDKQFEILDTDGALKPTILNIGEEWEIKRYKTLLSKARFDTMDEDAQKEEKNRCFDLLDAMSCSGSLPIDCASLHVIVPATHCFEDTMINTVVKKNINPIEKVERSTLIVASAIHKKSASDIVKPSHLSVVQTHSPQLMIDDTGNPQSGSQ